jgi:hypothetical protein
LGRNSHGDFRLLLRRQLGTAVVTVDTRGFLSGFHHFGEQSEFVGAADDLARAPRFDLALLQGGHDQTQRADAGFLARLHRLLHLRGHGIAHRDRIAHDAKLHPRPHPA